MAASRWRIEGNLIADFIKEDGDGTSHGAFVKGACTGNQFLCNVVLCEWRLRGESSAELSANLVDGLDRVRDDGILIDDGTGETTPACALYPRASDGAQARPDLCTTAPKARAYVGAFDQFDACLARDALSRQPARPPGSARP
jgi:hypothetical protein